MAHSDRPRLTIDLNQFKLHLSLPDRKPFTLHFDTPSRRFYLSVIALVVEEMRKKGGVGYVPLENHSDLLALLNETVGEGAGSSAKKSLLPRIYTKWKAALPDLESAPLFKVMGWKKGYDEAAGRDAYLFDEATKDAWANLFEYRGSRDKIRLRFSVERLGVTFDDVVIVYGYDETEVEPSRAWERFLNSISRSAGESGIEARTQESLPVGGAASQAGDLAREPSSQGFPSGLEGFDVLKEWIDGRKGIEKIPLKTRLEWIARLAMAPSREEHGAGPDKTQPDALKDALKEGPATNGDQGISHQISSILLQGIFKTQFSGMPYRAPELAAGQSPSSRSDVYALGVLLYQMVVGDLSRPLGSNWTEAVKDDILREDIALAVAEDPQKRLASPAILAERLINLNKRRQLVPAQIAQGTQERDVRPRQRVTRSLIYGLFGVVLILITGFLLYQNSIARVEEARKSAYEKDLPRLRGLLDEEKYVEALALARNTEKVIPDDPTLAQYIQEATNTIRIDTVPQGAIISYRPYKDFDGPWIELGTTPIPAAVIPVGMHRWRIQKESFQEREVAWAVLPRNGLHPNQLEFLRNLAGDPMALQLNLYEENRVPEGTIGVDAGRFQMALYGLLELPGMTLNQFFIDRTEVTNRAYKEFIQNGGYRDSKFWKQEFKKDGQVIPWAEAMKLFVDRTGQTGPSTWELGDYQDGQDDYPVSGVSWYEAAYAEFRNKSLPTIFHWVRATFPTREALSPITPYIAPQSNLEGNGPARVGDFPGIGSSGAKDMAGNVREWCLNQSGDEKRHSLGGMWRDPRYMFNHTFAMSEWDRSPGNGFRCVVYPEGRAPSAELCHSVDLGFYDPYSIPPYSKEAFLAMKAMYAYPRNPLNPVVEGMKEEGRGWKRETVSIEAAYNKERIILLIDLPTAGKPPFKTVVYFPPGTGWFQHKFARNPSTEPWDAIPKSGRAFITPIYSGLFERGGGAPDKSYKTTWFFEWVQDLGRTIDYLETRKDIDTNNLAFLGVSLGAQYGPYMTAIEDRIKVQILVGGGICLLTSNPKPMGLLVPYSTAATLMLNGKYDFLFPLETHQKPLFDLLGTPNEHKRHILYETGHTPLPRAEMLRDIMAWLDKYQGPVNGAEEVQQEKAHE